MRPAAFSEQPPCFIRPRTKTDRRPGSGCGDRVSTNYHKPPAGKQEKAFGWERYWSDESENQGYGGSALLKPLREQQFVKPLSPLIPNGSFLEQQIAGRRSKVRTVAVYVVGFHLLLLGAWLIQGCRHPHSAVGNTQSAQIFGTSGITSNGGILPTRPETNWSAAPRPSLVQTKPPIGATNVYALSAAPTTKDYRVAKGDTLSTIAMRNGITKKALTQANPRIELAKLKVGQLLRIPDSSQVALPTKHPASAEKSKALPTGGDSLYTVKSGDTVAKVARSHGTTVKALRALNELKSDQLVVGKTLKLPPPIASAENSRAPTLSTTASNLPAQP